MSSISFLSAFLGMRVWIKKIDCQNQGLIFVIPGHEAKLIYDLIPALDSYLSLENRLHEKIIIVYDDDKIKNFLCNQALYFEFIKLSKKEMNNLVCYMLFTNKHYGAMRHPNVKLMSFELLYGNQLNIIADNNLYPPCYLITEMILNRV